ncbi:hypothetical protein GALMADRAFT_144076 [Galerina marginata CBS 339.88]|uniref:Uncharacterized protein n=1 Tax=Galerina marginata (strain CBS 339.88) TaxID=685588 RepID=A0A067SJE0_GALM3|nr:hypothetical protein GALMADRAFT_144076 [Galerina marginata CBS 339.88]
MGDPLAHTTNPTCSSADRSFFEIPIAHHLPSPPIGARSIEGSSTLRQSDGDPHQHADATRTRTNERHVVMLLWDLHGLWRTDWLQHVLVLQPVFRLPRPSLSRPRLAVNRPPSHPAVGSRHCRTVRPAVPAYRHVALALTRRDGVEGCAAATLSCCTCDPRLDGCSPACCGCWVSRWTYAAAVESEIRLIVDSSSRPTPNGSAAAPFLQRHTWSPIPPPLHPPRPTRPPPPSFLTCLPGCPLFPVGAVGVQAWRVRPAAVLRAILATNECAAGEIFGWFRAIARKLRDGKWGPAGSEVLGLHES